MASELVQRLLDAGFPAAKPVHDHELFGIPTLEELIAAVEQIHPEFRLSVKRINPDEWEAHGGFISIDGEVTYWARHGLQPPPKHWQNFGSPFTRIITRNHWAQFFRKPDRSTAKFKLGCGLKQASA